MSDRYRREPPDEPVIGEEYPFVIGEEGSEETTIGEEAPEEAWAEEEAYAEEAYPFELEREPSEARQPLLYVFLALIVGFGALLVFLLLGGLNGESEPSPQLAVVVDRPQPNERIEVGQEAEAFARAAAEEPVDRFELYLDGRLVDAVQAGPPVNGVYSATMRFRLDEPGVYELWVRVLLQSGTATDSQKVRIVGVEPVGERPVAIEGEVIAAASVRTAPDDSAPSVRNLEVGDTVRAVGRTTDNLWLLLDGGGWVRRAAVRLLDSIELLPRRDPTPTPVPTETATPEPSPTETPTPAEQRPDLTPVNAALADGGRILRVTIANLAPTAFEGALEVEVAGLPQGALRRAFAVTIAENGNVTVSFELDPAITAQATVTVRVDPSNAVAELSEDNNSASFVLAPPTPAPELVIASVTVTGNAVQVTVRNDGGPLPASEVTVQIQLGNEVQSATRNIALASGQEASFSVLRPTGSGTATIRVLVSGTVVTTGSVELGET